MVAFNVPIKCAEVLPSGVQLRRRLNYTTSFENELSKLLDVAATIAIPFHQALAVDMGIPISLVW